jgi:hypothetical protein
VDVDPVFRTDTSPTKVMGLIFGFVSYVIISSTLSLMQKICVILLLLTFASSFICVMGNVKDKVTKPEDPFDND